MRFFGWVVRIVLFLLLLAFAAKNSEPVTVRFLFGSSWPAPLSLVILLAVATGVAFGLAVSLAALLRHRRDAARARREVRALRDRGEPRDDGPAHAG
jgi:uncharacterized integral membrane protein